MATHQYSAGNDEWDHDEDSRFDFPAGQKLYSENRWLISDQLAVDYHSNHDGWEATWPLRLSVWKDGVEVARFSVEREYEPSFYANDVDIPQVAA